MHAVVVEVAVNGAAESRRRQLGEVIGDARLPAADDDVGNGVTDRRVIDGARGGRAGASGFLAIEEARGLGLGEGVGAGAEAGERVRAGRVRRGAGANGVAEIVGAGERDGHAADRSFTRAELDAVVVEVAEDHARERTRRQLAEVIAGRGDIGRERDRTDDVARRIVHRRPTRGARGVFAIEEASGLGLSDDVSAGPQRAEGICAARVGGGGDIHRGAAVV